jgi:hypothetical protein
LLVTSSRSTTTSRAFWELRAEQVMDRVFSPAVAAVPSDGYARSDVTAARPASNDDDSIEVEVREAPAAAAMPPAAPQKAATPLTAVPSAPQQRVAGGRRRSAWGQAPWRPQSPLFNRAWLSSPWQIGGVAIPPKLALACGGGLACLALGTSATLWIGWNQASQDLRQERTIRLLEGIRQLDGNETAAAADPAEKATKEDTTARSDGLPPPPPTEPWIEELGQLEGQGSGGAAPLKVPVNGTLRAPAPVASASAWSGPPTPPPPVPSGSGGGATPELVGVVQIPGKPGSAIFQVGGSSTNATAGESIGSSGWRLVNTSGDSAVIERAGVSRRVSISSGV